MSSLRWKRAGRWCFEILDWIFVRRTIVVKEIDIKAILILFTLKLYEVRNV
jgi:hypothetical protein